MDRLDRWPSAAATPSAAHRSCARPESAWAARAVGPSGPSAHRRRSHPRRAARSRHGPRSDGPRHRGGGGDDNTTLAMATTATTATSSWLWQPGWPSSSCEARTAACRRSRRRMPSSSGSCKAPGRQEGRRQTRRRRPRARPRAPTSQTASARRGQPRGPTKKAMTAPR